MRMKVALPLALLIVTSLLLSACGGSAQPAAQATEAVTETEVVEVQEPTPTPLPEKATDEQLDAAYGAFLPAVKDNFKVMPVTELKERLDKEYQPSSADVAQPTKSFVVDVRDSAEIEQTGFILGAVNIPLRDLAKDLNKLPAFSSRIVVYCSDGFRSTVAVAVLDTLGWKDAYVLGDGGISGWIDAGYPVTSGLPLPSFPQNLAKPDPSLVMSMDAALTNLPEGFGSITPDALNSELADNTLISVDGAGTIDGADTVSIPLADFVANRSQWPAEKDAAVVIYDADGSTSPIAMLVMASYGYTNVRSLQGGLAAWTDAGLPVSQ